MKILGPSRGINLMGILGGLASSTATTISFSSASREYPQMAQHYARGSGFSVHSDVSSSIILDFGHPSTLSVQGYHSIHLDVADWIDLYLR